MIIKNFISKNKHFFWLLTLVPLFLFFILLERDIVPKYIIYSELDDKIPFVKEFVIPYVIWFAYVAFGIIFTGFCSKTEYTKLVWFLAGTMSIAYAVYAIFPNGINLRPEITQTDPLSSLIKFIYSTDTPTNVCPSLHVMNSIATHVALSRTDQFKRNKIWTVLSLVLAISICMSTVFIKQHSILDAFWGFAVCTVLFMLIYKAKPMMRKNRELDSVR